MSLRTTILMLAMALPAGAEVICTEPFEPDANFQVPEYFLDATYGLPMVACGRAQWLVGMFPSAHDGPVFPVPGGPAQFAPDAVCADGGNGPGDIDKMWTHDHGGVVDLPAPLRRDPTRHFQCPDSPNVGWAQNHGPHLYPRYVDPLTNRIQGHGWGGCKATALTSCSYTVPMGGEFISSTHEGPVLCEILRPHTSGTVDVERTGPWKAIWQNGIVRARSYTHDGTVTLLGEWPIALGTFDTVIPNVPFAADQAAIFIDGKVDTTYSGLSSICLDVPDPLAVDFDWDGKVDDLDDNCSDVQNPSQCDSDQDGYGNACDTDYDQDNFTLPGDLAIMEAALPIFASGVTDHDCDGFTTPGDYEVLEAALPTFAAPGPSGLSCAGTVPCLP